MIETKVTDPSGIYLFANLFEGLYYVKLNGNGIPANYVSSTGEGEFDQDGSGPFEPASGTDNNVDNEDDDEDTKNNTEIKECIDAALGVCRSGSLGDNVEVKEYGVDGIKINIDETELKQIFINLFQNAFEAIHERFNKKPGGTLRVSVQQTSKDTKIEVRDNGTGIKEDDIPLLFDPHFTTKNAGSSKVGLGLNVTYRLLLKNHGKISVESSGESGTVFLLTIPSSHSG